MSNNVYFEPNLNSMYMFAFRYALGRRTFAPNIVTEFLSDKLQHLSDSTLTQMVREIDECEDYGDNCDRTVWLEFRQDLVDAITLRAEISHSECEERITWTKPIEECKAEIDKLKDAVKQGIKLQLSKLDNVNHPSHYCDGKIEVIDYIEDKKLNYHLGNVVKYVSRAGKKDESKTIEDLKKARWYLDRYITKLEEANEETIRP